MKSYLVQILSLILLSNTHIGAQVPPNPILWLDAAVGISQNAANQISEWKSKNNQYKAFQDVAANQATYIPSSIGNLPAVRFNGSNSFMEASSVFPVSKDYTVVIVSQAFGPSQNIVGGNSRTIWMAGTTTPTMLHNGDFANQVKSSIDPGIEPSIIIAQYRNQNQQGQFYVNSLFADSAYCPQNLDSSIFLSAYQKCCFFNGDISEIMIYDRIISSQERIALENYLFNKYKINKPGFVDSTFSIIPKNYELLPRDQNNQAIIKIAGIINKIPFDSVKCTIYKNNLPYFNSTKSLQFLNGKASIIFNPMIEAGLHEYKLEIHLLQQKKDSLIKIVDHIVCGDVFIITGQSNSIFGGTNLNNTYCRTFGKNYSFNKADTAWRIASAAGYGGGPDIGAWGMFMANQLIDSFQIPICIMNGGVGGTAIEQHQRNDITPYEPNSIYGSLNYRMLISGLSKYVKGIFWYQGESNSSNLYFENFRALYQDWLQDYPNIKKVYVIQIHHGCGAGDHNKVRDIQRKLPESFPLISLMSTMALPGHDGCHYNLDGYATLGDRMYYLVARDFYGMSPSIEIDAPNIQKAYYTSKQFDEIALLFAPNNQGLKIQNDSIIGLYNISVKDYLYLDHLPKKIKSLRINKDTLFAKLTTPALVKTISYLPEINYLDTALVYQGPYITNLNGVGTLTFYDVPVDPELNTNIIGIQNNNQITTQPNPINGDQLGSLRFNSEVDLNDAQIYFYTLNGTLCYQGTIISKNPSQYGIQVSSRIHEIPSGLLIYQISNSKRSYFGKMLVN
ncbi:MAG: hypothetical protein IPQ02_13050 [Saprospiraceae bacterium]|nr:hypothetical protein [Candidatus Defluviibacterium haderslevense]